MKLFSRALVFFGLIQSEVGLFAQSQGTRPSQLDGFVPIDQLPPSEQLPAAPMLIAAYILIWMLVLGYVWITWRRLMKAEGELARFMKSKRAAS
jgi:hypothetical protein